MGPFYDLGINSKSKRKYEYNSNTSVWRFGSSSLVFCGSDFHLGTDTLSIMINYKCCIFTVAERSSHPVRYLW